MESPHPNPAALFQAASSLRDNQVLELSSDVEAKHRAFLFTGSSGIDLDADPASVATQLEAQGSSPEDAVRLALAMGTEQAPVDRSKRGVFGRVADVLEPEFAPTTLIDIYHDDPDVRAAVDTRASLVAGLGWKVEPKPWVINPDPQQKATFMDFLQYAAGEESLSLQLWAMYRDQLVVGTGYMEIGRNVTASVKSSLQGMKYARSYVTRMGKTLDRYYQIHGEYSVVFRRIGYLDDKPYAVVAETTKKRLGAAYTVAIDFVDVAQGRDILDKMKDGYRPDIRLLLAEVGQTGKLDLQGISTKPNAARVEATTEMMHMAQPAMNDSVYGMPPVINALRDWAANRYIREMNLNFWDNNTIPPLLVIASGERMPRNMADNIRQALTRNRGRDAFSKAVLLELPEGTTLELKPLTEFIQQEGAFRQTLNDGATTIHKSFRTPRTLTEVVDKVAAGDSKEIHRWYIESVIRPDQAEIEHRINWLARNYLGITDWQFRLASMTLDDARTLAEIDQIYLRGAVYSPNDVLNRLGMPGKPGGEYAAKTVPGVGVLLLEAVKKISDRVESGDRVRDLLVPRGAQTPPNASPMIKPAGEKKLEAANSGDVYDPILVGFTKDGIQLVGAAPGMLDDGGLP